VRSDRLLATLLLLQTHGRLPAPEIARRLEVSTRTVARDVEALSAAGVPVYAERGRLGGVVLMPGFRTDVSGLTDGEMRALLALTDGEQGGSLGQAVASAVRKLLAAVPEARRPGITAARRTVVVEQYGWHRAGRPVGDAPALGALDRAVADDERVRIRYRSAAAEAASWRTVDPYGLVSKAGTWYLVAAARGTPRMFRVSRVEEVAATGTPARRPDDRDLEQVWIELRDRLEQAPEAVTVRVRVVPGRRAMVERVVAPQLVGPPEVEDDQRDDQRDDEPDVVRLTFRAAGAAVGSLLGLGAMVEVLGPPEVRDLMAERAAQAVALYR
jgi:predicted DNA-binding transcriptional regulator YafY